MKELTDEKNQINFDSAIEKIKQVQNQFLFKKSSFREPSIKIFDKALTRFLENRYAKDMLRDQDCNQQKAKFLSMILPKEKVFNMDKDVVLEDGKTTIRRDAFLLCNKTDVSKLEDSIEILQLTGDDAGKFFDNKSIQFNRRDFGDSQLASLRAGDYEAALYGDCFYGGHKLIFSCLGNDFCFYELSSPGVSFDMSVFEISEQIEACLMNKPLAIEDETDNSIKMQSLEPQSDWNEKGLSTEV